MDAARAELARILREARSLVERPGNDFSRSSWEDAAQALRELDGLIAALEVPALPRRLDFEIIFLPTGPLQELSLSSGWPDEFVVLADRVDGALMRAYGA